MPKPPIIDMHLHASEVRTQEDGSPRPRVAMPGPDIPEPELTPTTQEQLLDRTLAAMDEHNIVLGMLSSRFPELLDSWMDHAPGRFIGSVWVDGTDETSSAEYVRGELEAGRHGAIGEVITQYAGIAPNDPRAEPYFALAEEFDVPILVHCLGIGASIPTFRASFGNPLLLEEALVRHPNLRLWVENAGFPFFGEMMSIMYQYPNVYVDVSTTTWLVPRPAFYNHLKQLVDAGLADRIMFGSDQMSWPQTIGMAIDTVESAPFLTGDQKRDIFYNNAARFLRLDT